MRDAMDWISHDAQSQRQATRILLTSVLFNIYSSDIYLTRVQRDKLQNVGVE